MLQVIVDWLNNLQPWQQGVTLMLAFYGFVKVVIEVIAMLVKFVKWLYRRIWEGRDNWNAISTYFEKRDKPDTDPSMAFLGGRKKRWCSLTPQEKDVFYTLDIGKERIISDIEFDSGVSLESYPAKFRIVIVDGQQKIIEDIEKEGPIRHSLEPARKIQYIRVIITEPNCMQNGNAYHWAIHDIKLREVRLWGLWKTIIR